MKDTKTPDLFANDLDATQELLCGIDEAGRGPLAGPVYAAAVILDPKRPIEGLRDSKKLTEAQREAIAPEIKEKALAWAIAEASVEEIDQMNILQATLLAMRRAVDALPVKPELVLVDGNRLPILPYRAEAVVKGDDKVPAISAASILAKTARDAVLRDYETRFPGYGFAQHKGYGVKAHIEAIEKLGLLPVHRKTFEPIKSKLHAKKGSELL